MSTSLRFLARDSGKATVHAGGLLVSSAAKGVWRGAVIDGQAVAPGGSGSFTTRVRKGLIRVGWLSDGGDENALGTDACSYGFGGTGKKSHAGVFEDFGEAFGEGDTISCSLSRTDGCFSLEYTKNGNPLGMAFHFREGTLPAGLGDAVFIPAVCGRQFEAELCGVEGQMNTHKSVDLPTCSHSDELLAGLRCYVSGHLGRGPPSSQQVSGDREGKRKAKKPTSEEAIVDLRSFFLTEAPQHKHGQSSEGGAARRWVRSALLGGQEAQRSGSLDLAGCKEVKRVVNTVALPSGPVLCLVDSKPADRAGDVDRCFAQNIGLWESLPRGHAEVREGSLSGPLLCEVVGLRKFGNAEERFGPLAHEAGCSRRAALRTLPAALNAELGPGAWAASLLFLTKENGEMCKVAFFKREGVPYLVVGSKNVILAVCASDLEAAKADLEVYTDSRFAFAREMAEVFLPQLFQVLSPANRQELVSYLSAQGATLSGESISPGHQHIQSYCDASGEMSPQIRFFSLTAPRSFEAEGLTLLDPADCLRRLSSWGLQTVEACDEASLLDPAAVRCLEEKHLLLPNREGAVVYVVVRAAGRSRTALVYKWKNSWYVTVRALREKFCARAPEDRIRGRIRSLHVHHPDEVEIVEDFIGFYRWALALLPSSGFRDVLAGNWVSLKSAYVDFRAGHEAWASRMPPALIQQLGEIRVQRFAEVVSALEQQVPLDSWIRLLTRHKKLLDEGFLEQGLLPDLAPLLTAKAPGVTPESKLQAEEPKTDVEVDPVGLTVVLARGLQGSGKSTLCRGLQALLGGRWVNQDEVAAASGSQRRGPAPKELFLRAVESAASQEGLRYLFIDKIHTLRQHREDVCEAVRRGIGKRPGSPVRVGMALLNLTHPDDEEGQSEFAAPVCSERVTGRGVGHLSFLPQASAVEQVIAEAARHAEVLGDDEKCAYDLYTDVDLRLGPAELLRHAVERLEAAELLAENNGRPTGPEAFAEAVVVAKAHEQGLQSRWKTLYWSVKVDWEDVLWGSVQGENEGPGEGVAAAPDTARESLHKALLSAINGTQDLSSLQPIEEPHVTLVYLGKTDPDEAASELSSRLLSREGERVRIVICGVVSDSSLGLVALRVRLEDGKRNNTVPCENKHPHLTTAKRPEVPAVTSNDMLERLSQGDADVREEMLLEPLVVEGTICRKLAVEPGSLAAAATGALPETGNPICGLGLATTGDAVDIWATYDASVRWNKMLRTFEKLFCTVTEPLSFCHGSPPRLRGKQWFTFHERPLAARSLASLRALEAKKQLQTLHVGAVYFQAPEVLTKGKDEMQAQLQSLLAEEGTDALVTALSVWREVRATEDSGHVAEPAQEAGAAAVAEAPKQVPKFYIHCKHSGSQEVAVRFRQVLANTIASITGWEPVIKEPEVTLAVTVKNDWILVGLVLPRLTPPSPPASGGASGGAAAGTGAPASNKRTFRISKELTLILRHSAVKHGVGIRPDGFCPVAEVLRVKPLAALRPSLEELKRVVSENDKQRFELREEEGGLMVRAVQGHSISTVEDLQLLRPLKASDPDLPKVCVHGTYRKHLVSIVSQGLLAGGTTACRKHAHFSQREPGDESVISGMRYNCEVAVYLDLKGALEGGVPFFLSANEVVLSPGVDGVVPPAYITGLRDLRTGEWLDMARLSGGAAAAPKTPGHSQVSDGVLELNGAYMEGGGQLIRNACTLAAILRSPLHINNVREGREQSGLSSAHVATLSAIRDLGGVDMTGLVERSSEITVSLPSSSGFPQEPLAEPLVVSSGAGGSTALMLQGALPLMLARSAASGGTKVCALLQGGTNVAHQTQGGNSPQVDYLDLVLFPTLERLFGLSLDLQLHHRGFWNGGGEVEVSAACPRWPLEAFDMTEQGEVLRVHGIVYRSAGVPAHVLPRLLSGKIGKRPAGAALLLQQRLPDVPVTWEKLEVDSVAGSDACGIVVALTTTSGCILAGDSMGRKGAPAEKVGEEAVLKMLEALDSKRCADTHLEDQLVVFMSLASGWSRLRLGFGTSSLHAHTAVWLTEQFGAEVRTVTDDAGQVLEIKGVGAPLR